MYQGVKGSKWNSKRGDNMNNSMRKHIMICTGLCAVVAVTMLIIGFLKSGLILEANTIRSNVIRLENETLKTSKVYDVEFQKTVSEQIQKLKDKKTYSEKDMLLVYNPFQLNVQSMYVYFTTKTAASVSYTVHVDSKKINDFTATLYNDGNKNYTKEHEYQLIGLIPEMENTVTFTITHQNGKIQKKQFQFTPDALTGKEYEILPSTDGTSSQVLSNGLYAVFSENEYFYYYDNDGVIRSEIPILGYRVLRLLFDEGKMYYSISKTKMVEMNRLGQVTAIYDTGKYQLHHDYVFDGDGNILILGTDTKGDSIEDRVLRLNRKNGKVKQIIDLADYYPDYYEEHMEYTKTNGEYDWMHLNTIQWIGDDSIIVSARETSAIIKISNIYKNPKIEYMLSEESFWKGTGYKKLLYRKESDFRSQTGQHTVTYEKDPSLREGQYYLHMFNNNVGKTFSRPDYDWNAHFDKITDSGTKGYTSYYYKYLVDENTKSYELVDSYEVAYSGYVSSTQHMDQNHIVDSGQAFTLVEYDNSGNAIRTFELTPEGKYCYRVYKYTFEGFYFAN